jgi:alginate O-acetyltransferase complex protein AlgJ
MSHPKTGAAGMLLRYRRVYFVVTFTLLATPLIMGLVRPDSPELVYKEGRSLEPWPGMPAGLAQLSALPAQMDSYLNDHFGLRHAMIKLHQYLNYPVLMGSRDALIGRGGRFFYQRNEMIRQSAGIVFRDQRIVEAVSFLTSIRNKLAERGARFLVAIPPNSATIYQDELPYWAQSRGRKTEYDLFLGSLAARGIKTVDLRPTMKAVRKDGESYLMHDSHWTSRGAVAGFNAIVEADGHPDWRIDPAEAIGPPAERKGGDIARMIGLQDDVTEVEEKFKLPLVGKDEALSTTIMPDHVVTTGRPGPSILVIGDSFTERYFPIMLAQRVSGAIWVDYQECGFDAKLIDKFHPDEVGLVGTE